MFIVHPITGRAVCNTSFNTQTSNSIRLFVPIRKSILIPPRGTCLVNETLRDIVRPIILGQCSHRFPFHLKLNSNCPFRPFYNRIDHRSTDRRVDHQRAKQHADQNRRRHNDMLQHTQRAALFLFLPFPDRRKDPAAERSGIRIECI